MAAVQQRYRQQVNGRQRQADHAEEVQEDVPTIGQRPSSGVTYGDGAANVIQRDFACEHSAEHVIGQAGVIDDFAPAVLQGLPQAVALDGNIGRYVRPLPSGTEVTSLLFFVIGTRVEGAV